jgi:hypothetical protein
MSPKIVLICTQCHTVDAYVLRRDVEQTTENQTVRQKNARWEMGPSYQSRSEV